MITIRVDTAAVEQRLGRTAAALDEGGAAIQNAATEVLSLIRKHLAYLAQTRHATARRLGATPTGHIRAQAATITDVMPDSATINIAIPGIRRAYEDITIRPREKQWLTIPFHAWAYGRTVSTVARTMRIFRPLAKGGKRGTGPHKNYLATVRDGRLIVLYLLRQVVRQPRDPSLMPSDEEMQQAFAQGYGDALEALMEE